MTTHPPPISNRAVLTFGLLALAAWMFGCGISEPYVRAVETNQISAVPDSLILRRIFLIGDAGASRSTPPDPTFVALRRSASHEPRKNTIVFLGDNIYPDGMPDSTDVERSNAERRLMQQIAVVESSGARGIFIPGNHDWAEMGEDGLERIRHQAAFIASVHNASVEFQPTPGTPGPAVLDAGDDLHLVVLDTQWWLHRYRKEFYPGFPTEEAMQVAIADSLGRILASLDHRQTIVLGHHPLVSHGPHGGFFDWRDHVFPLRHIAPWMWLPLPVVGELYPLARTLGVVVQDGSSASYEQMRRAFERVFARHPPLLYAAGHEHVLEILEHDGGRYLQIVSGNGIIDHDSPLTTDQTTLFADRRPGFVRIDLLNDGRARLIVVEPIDDQGESREVFSMWIKEGGGVVSP